MFALFCHCFIYLTEITDNLLYMILMWYKCIWNTYGIFECSLIMFGWISTVKTVKVLSYLKMNDNDTVTNVIFQHDHKLRIACSSSEIPLQAAIPPGN